MAPPNKADLGASRQSSAARATETGHARSVRPPPAGQCFTPDGRYLIVRGRLWRTSNPDLEPALRQRLVDALMAARRAVAAARRADDATALVHARSQVDAAKHALGERGPVWWTDGAPDLNRHMVHTTPYAQWWDALTS